MKSRQLFTKAIAKTSTLLLIGATAIGSSMSVYAQSIPQTQESTCSQKAYTKTTTSNKNYSNVTVTTKPNGIIIGTGTCKPGTVIKPGVDCPETGNKPDTDCTPDTDSKPGTDNIPDTDSKPGTDNIPDTDSKPSTDNTPDTEVSTQTQFENRVLELVNLERAKVGLKALQMDESVREVARLKSQDMRSKNYFDHTSPTYGSPFDMLKKFSISYKSAGENIAKGYTTPEAVVNGWMNSEGHRANILNSSFTHIGIGYEATGNYWTQMFIGK